MSHGAMSTPRAPSRPGLYHDYTPILPPTVDDYHPPVPSRAYRALTRPLTPPLTRFNPRSIHDTQVLRRRPRVREPSRGLRLRARDGGVPRRVRAVSHPTEHLPLLRQLWPRGRRRAARHDGRQHVGQVLQRDWPTEQTIPHPGAGGPHLLQGQRQRRTANRFRRFQRRRRNGRRDATHVLRRTHRHHHRQRRPAEQRHDGAVQQIRGPRVLHGVLRGEPRFRG